LACLCLTLSVPSVGFCCCFFLVLWGIYYEGVDKLPRELEAGKEVRLSADEV
jgi:hypothetical protein